MNRTLTLIVAIAAGAFGGLFPRYFTPTPVQAQASAPTEIRAQSFVLVDKNNNVVGTFKSSEQRGRVPSVVLLDQSGREIWRAGTSVRALALK